jgi:hypothetical protein
MEKDLKSDVNVDYEAGLEYEDELACDEVELEVEAYSPHELKSKKRSIVTRVAVAGVIVAIGMGVTGLVVNFYYPDLLGTKEPTTQTRPVDDFRGNVLGGSGSWFLSRLERVHG